MLPSQNTSRMPLMLTAAGQRVNRDCDVQIALNRRVFASPAYIQAMPSHCRNASYAATATALERFKLRTALRVGIRSWRSFEKAANKASGKPEDSLPNTKT